MIRRAFALAGAVCLAAPLAAQQATQRFDYKPTDHIQEIDFGLDKIRIRRVVFRAGRQAGGPLKGSSGECVVRIDNDGDVPVAVGVAVVVMDGEGHIVATGSGGTRVGWLLPGERDTSTIRFSFVYRNFAKAKTFLITMEMRKKEPATPGPQSTPP